MNFCKVATYFVLKHSVSDASWELYGSQGALKARCCVPEEAWSSLGASGLESMKLGPFVMCWPLPSCMGGEV